MAYIGTPVQQALTKVTSQSFNGTGSQTVFTLNRAVNTGEELEVFVNNVQQEPGVGKSYTATGTTLTFDAAPSSGTGNVYVIYRGLAEVTRRLEHDPGNPLAATTGTFSGGLAATTGTFSGGLAGFGNTAGSSTSDGFGFNQIKFSDDAYNDQPRGPNKVSMYQDTYGLGISSSSFDLYAGNGTFKFNQTTGGASPTITERLRILSTGGITFNGDTAAANALDDYEEGTWTPVSGSITLGSSLGYYTKVGNMVFIIWQIQFPSNSNGNSAIVSGLPFNVGSGQYSGTTSITNFVSTNILPMVNHSDNTITFRNYSNGTYTNANMSSKFHYGWAVYST